MNSLYSVLPETKDTQHAKEQTQLHSEVENDPVNTLDSVTRRQTLCYTQDYSGESKVLFCVAESL